jgi:hypothetical protein
MNIFTLSDENDLTDKINLDDLFEKKREIAESKLVLYNKILNRIHNKIKLTSNQNRGKEQFIWYVIPEIMIGVSRYDVAECTGYIIRKLRENDLVVRYTHPNLVFISWAHWIPGYVRQEYKKQTGKVIDGYGNTTDNTPQIENGAFTNPDDVLLNNKGNSIVITKEKGSSKDNSKDKEYISTKNYKPTGIYNNDILQRIQNKFT